MFDKVMLALLQNATALMYYKKGQALSQSWAHVLHTKKGKWYYKVGQALQRTVYLATKNFSLRIPEKLNFCYNFKEEEIMISS